LRQSEAAQGSRHTGKQEEGCFGSFQVTLGSRAKLALSETDKADKLLLQLRFRAPSAND
jgi:hypothetical protein